MGRSSILYSVLVYLRLFSLVRFAVFPHLITPAWSLAVPGNCCFLNAVVVFPSQAVVLL